MEQCTSGWVRSRSIGGASRLSSVWVARLGLVLVWDPRAQIEVWRLPLLCLHLPFEWQFRERWFFRRQLKQQPLFCKIFLRLFTSGTEIQFIEECDCWQNAQTGGIGALATKAEVGAWAWLWTRRGGCETELLALSRAISSCSKVSRRLSTSKSSAETLRLTIRRMSGGSLLRSKEESMAPYDSGSTPKAFKLQMLASDWLYSRLRSRRWLSEVTALILNKDSMFRDD